LVQLLVPAAAAAFTSASSSFPAITAAAIGHIALTLGTGRAVDSPRFGFKLFIEKRIAKKRSL
jgi:hypothetical protein